VNSSLSLKQIYGKLYKCYGPQHWWPADSPFEVIVGAIMTQSTAWTNVEKAIRNIKSTGKLTPEGLRRLPEKELAALIHPCGYYNVKARKLKAFVDWFGEQHGDSLEKMFYDDVNHVRKQLLQVYGIGEETADSILLYAGDKPVFVIDAYTRRIINRLGLAPENSLTFCSSPTRGEVKRKETDYHHSYADYQTLFMSNLPPDAAFFNEYHALLVRLGKEHCRKRPICEGCCLSEDCTGKTKNQISKTKNKN
jgi:endonuclease-3 related protein